MKHANTSQTAAWDSVAGAQDFAGGVRISREANGILRERFRITREACGFRGNAGDNGGGRRFNLHGGLHLRFGGGCGRGGFWFSLRFADRADHVETALRVVLEFVVQDAFAAVQRVFQADEFVNGG